MTCSPDRWKSSDGYTANSDYKNRYTSGREARSGQNHAQESISLGICLSLVASSASSYDSGRHGVIVRLEMLAVTKPSGHSKFMAAHLS
jgi:hypothetical protein